MVHSIGLLKSLICTLYSFVTYLGNSNYFFRWMCSMSDKIGEEIKLNRLEGIQKQTTIAFWLKDICYYCCLKKQKKIKQLF